jgi:hypothetical protein
MIKIIRLTDETHSELENCGKKGETFEKIVKRLIDFYKKGVKK